MPMPAIEFPAQEPISVPPPAPTRIPVIVQVMDERRSGLCSVMASTLLAVRQRRLPLKEEKLESSNRAEDAQLTGAGACGAGMLQCVTTAFARMITTPKDAVESAPTMRIHQRAPLRE